MRKGERSPRTGCTTNNPFSRVYAMNDRCFVCRENVTNNKRVATANYVVTNFFSTVKYGNTRTLRPNIVRKRDRNREEKKSKTKLNGNIISFRTADKWKPENGRGPIGKLPNSHQAKISLQYRKYNLFFDFHTLRYEIAFDQLWEYY